MNRQSSPPVLTDPVLSAENAGHPWLPAVDPELQRVAQQRGDDASLLSLYRRLIEFRRLLDGPFALLEVDNERLLFRRGRHLVDLNIRPSEGFLGAGRPLLSTEPAAEIRSVPPFGGVILEQAVV